MEENKKTTSYSLKKYIVWSVVYGLLFLVGVSVFVVCRWYLDTYDFDFQGLLYVLSSPLKGTGNSTVNLVLSSCVPWALGAALLYVAASVLGGLYLRHRVWFRRVASLLCVGILLFSLVFAVIAFGIPDYLNLLNQRTSIYEEYYVDPDKVAITAEGKPKNLIYIYLESMETTYVSKAEGGAQEDVNYLPNLTKMAYEHTFFTENTDGTLGGFHTTNGSYWTMGALLATTSGIPFSFPVEGNSMSKHETFASGLTNLGDILAEKGYKQEFLCGSDATFGGRRNYFEQHGNYEIFDIYTAREEGYIADDYYVWWGYEDAILYEIAKNELTELAAGDQPFNFTMLTVDTHHVDGYRCNLCGYEYGDATSGEQLLGNVLSCADRQIQSFIDWCKEQDFYEDSVIIVTGDHHRMDKTLVAGVREYERTIYNCYINAAVEPAGATTGRVFTSFDIFPTTLAAMGFTIEGNRLGLGVNLFSGEQTLAEELGYAYLNAEISKFSDYYIREFS